MTRPGTNLETVVDAQIINLGEELIGKRLPEFKAEVEEALEQGNHNLILDCKELKVINSEGLEMLLWTIEEVQGAGGLVKIASMGEVPHKIFEITQFDRIFEFYSDVIAALKSL